MESVYGTIKKELVYPSDLQTAEEAIRKIFKHIEIYYNRRRLHSPLGYLTPAEYERTHYENVT